MKQKFSSTIRIVKAANGYIVTNGETMSAEPPFVFESFEALSKWLAENFGIDQ